jgi:hypothetical protein
MRLFKTRITRLLPLLFLGGLILISCNQAPIFYYISNEYEPKDPTISGGPTKIVEFQGKAYVSNGTIYRYSPGTSGGAGTWAALGKGAPRAVKDLAATGAYLYALSVPGTDINSAVLYRMDAAENWKEAAKGALQAIYGAGDSLFAGTGNSQSNILFYINDMGASLSPLRDFGVNGELQGAAFLDNTYYIATAGLGIFAVSAENLMQTEVWEAVEPLPASANAGTIRSLFVVRDAANAALIALSGRGKLWWMKPGEPARVIKESSVTFTGSAAVWKDANNPGEPLLLTGVQLGSGVYTYGYREFPLKAIVAGTDPGSPRTPGEGTGVVSSVDNYPKYSTSLGKYVVNSLYQAEDGILFASTQKNGLWAYRDNEWNAEE